jgi:hypothetical protein
MKERMGRKEKGKSRVKTGFVLESRLQFSNIHESAEVHYFRESSRITKG